MNPKIYLKLLRAIEGLRSSILDINPNANTAELDSDIQELYGMVNAYNDARHSTDPRCVHFDQPGLCDCGAAKQNSKE